MSKIRFTIALIMISAMTQAQPFKLTDNSVQAGQFQHFYEVHFGVDSPYLQLTALAQLDSIVRFLKLNPSIKIELGVHTDLRGDDKQNLNLSKKRATTLREFLVDKGISPTRIKAIGFGEAKTIIEYEDWKKLTDTHRSGYSARGNCRLTIVIKAV